MRRGPSVLLALMLAVPVLAVEFPGDPVIAPAAGRVTGSPKPRRLSEAITPTLRRELDTPSGLGSTPVIVGTAPGLDPNEVATRMRSAGIVVAWVERSAPTPQVGLRVPAGRLGAFREALEPFDGRIVFADIQPGARLLNSRSAPLCQGGGLEATPIFDRGLRGEGQVVALMDTGIDADSCFFDDPDHGLPVINDDTGTDVSPEHRKILAVDFWWDEDLPAPGPWDWDSQGHGTHTAGSIAGDADVWGTHQGNDGMAPAAKLVIQDGGFAVDACADLPGLGCPVRPLGPMLEQAWAQGARIHSNSWGDAEDSWPSNRYTERAADIDRFVRDHPEMLVVAAAGNSGGMGDDTVISPSTGKNVLSVGALGPADDEVLCPVSFSSRGWTDDGRIKPDVVAPGTAVWSASNDFVVGIPSCSVQAMSGTSMATPTVAGLAALVRQYFMEGRQAFGRPDPERAFEPTSALVRAVLIASAVDLTTLGCATVDPVPSRAQGWGLVRLDRALWFEGDDHRMWAFDRRGPLERTGEELQFVFDAHHPSDLKVVLVWTDVESSSTAAVHLLNDLDLEVEGPTGLYLGNTFEGGRSVPGGETDRRNTVEVVYLPDASPGRWVVRVRSAALPVGAQDFALVVLGADDVRLISPPRPPGDGRARVEAKPSGIDLRHSVVYHFE